MATAKKKHWSDGLFMPLFGVTSILLLLCIHLIFYFAPVEKQMGIVQKIFYFHAPSAYAMYLGATACFIGSIGYLLKGTDGFDALARAGAELSVIFACIVLTTGPLWGSKAWGVFWTWDPRLTTTLLSMLIYVAYNVLRVFAGDGPGERKFAAALGILGAANLPIIHFSVEKWAGQHPKVIMAKGGGGLHPDMKIVFFLALFTFTLLCVCFLWARVKVELARSRLATLEEEAIDQGLDDRTEA